MIFICPLDICAYKLNSFFLFNNIQKITSKHTQTFPSFFFIYHFLFSFLFFFFYIHIYIIQIKRNKAIDFNFCSLFSIYFSLFLFVSGLLPSPPICPCLLLTHPSLFQVVARPRGRPTTELRCAEESRPPTTCAVRYPLDQVDRRPFFFLRLAVRRQRTSGGGEE